MERPFSSDDAGPRSARNQHLATNDPLRVGGGLAQSQKGCLTLYMDGDECAFASPAGLPWSPPGLVVSDRPDRTRCPVHPLYRTGKNAFFVVGTPARRPALELGLDEN